MCPSRRITSGKLSAVSGLTNIDAPSAALASSGRTMQSRAFSLRYWVYIAPPSIPTVLPISACAAGPAATTVPAPSLPTGSDWSSRAFIAPSRSGGIGAGQRRAVGVAARDQRGGVGGAQQQAEVARVDRGRLDPDDDLVVGRDRRR